MTTQNNPAKSKKNILASITNVIHKVFDFFKGAIFLIAFIVKNFMSLTVFFMRFLFGVLSEPTLPTIVISIFFALTVLAAGYQWWGIGVWLSSIFGLTQVWGIAGGMLGLLFGFGINVFQLAPQLWKLDRSMAKAYDELDIDPEAQLDKPTLKEKLKNWLSFDHKTLKGMRLTSYSIETGVVLTYLAFVGQFQFWAICLAASSLLLPEKTLEALAATIDVTQAVSRKMREMQAHEDEMKKFGF